MTGGRQDASYFFGGSARMAYQRGTMGWVLAAGSGFLGLLLAADCLPLAAQTQDSAAAPVASAPNATPATPAGAAALPRGKKLFLKDGSFQLVREYRIEGDRVRYYSLDSSQWEQMPEALVDWEATKKIEEQEARRDAAIVAKAQAREAERHAEPLDIDASLEVAPGIFLPPGEGLFLYDGRALQRLAQAETASKLAKRRLLEQVLVPVPIVPSSHTVSIHGPRAKLRLGNPVPEFYMRTVDAREPDIELLRAKLKGENRQIENTDELFGQRRANRDTIPIQRWQVARGVYRFTLGQPLPPGEYAVAEIVQGEALSVYVWDFGVEGAPGGSK